MIKDRIIIIAASLLCFITSSAQSMKMVVDSKGNVVGEYLKTNSSTYTVSTQEEFEVPKVGIFIVIFSAANGQVYVYRAPEHKGNINVRKGPSTNSAVIGKIIDSWAYDELLEAFPSTFAIFAV